MNIYQENLLKSIDLMIEEKVKQLNYVYEITGKITEVISNDEYKFLYNDDEHIVKSINSDVYVVGDIVYILILNNDFSRKIILCKKP